MDNNDLNQDGKIDDKELNIIVEKLDNQTKIVWIAFISMVLTLISILFFIPVVRLEAIGSLLDLYWVAFGSIVGVFIGVKSWINK